MEWYWDETEQRLKSREGVCPQCGGSKTINKPTPAYVHNYVPELIPCPQCSFESFFEDHITNQRRLNKALYMSSVQNPTQNIDTMSKELSAADVLRSLQKMKDDDPIFGTRKLCVRLESEPEVSHGDDLYVDDVKWDDGIIILRV